MFAQMLDLQKTQLPSNNNKLDLSIITCIKHFRHELESLLQLPSNKHNIAKQTCIQGDLSTSRCQMLGLCNFRAPPRLLVECKTRSTNIKKRCSDIHMLLELKKSYKLFVVTSQNLLKEVCAIGAQQNQFIEK